MSGQLLLWEHLNLISTTTVNGVLYGIALSLYVLSVQLFYSQLQAPNQRRHVMFIFAYTSVVMICKIISLTLQTWIVQLAYIDHNTFPRATKEYEEIYLFTQSGGIMADAFNLVIDILTLGIQLWRWLVWVVWMVWIGKVVLG
ncbi:hypothetical protein P691DRAFT_816436 [Macrolepiota fuliginosa MF-IS2]|uniref:Uncharacterized protein n=1 Tax=Macrolepiota fuliginosa MF-IS2 TaxID=1400762 RepID=A0A9P6BWY7_9AGAR|nr:hypothetical protein P691DRAFT_816436 [Macrolepiota fuliginosa MF-IS2]